MAEDKPYTSEYLQQDLTLEERIKTSIKGI